MREDWVNLCFHGVGEARREMEPGEEKYWISTEFFRRILDVVHERGAVSLSFDDGNASDADVAVPALLDRGLRADFFPLAQRLDTPGSVASRDLADMRAAGFRIGSHGSSHRSWRGLSGEQARLELVAARDVIAEAAGAAVTIAALPFGEYDSGTLRALRRAGYQRVYSSDRARPRPGGWFQARYSIATTDDLDSVRQVLDHRPPRLARLADRARIAIKSAR